MQKIVLLFDPLMYIKMFICLMSDTVYMWRWLSTNSHACVFVLLLPFVPNVVLFHNVVSRLAVGGRQDGAKRVSAGQLISGIFTRAGTNTEIWLRIFIPNMPRIFEYSVLDDFRYWLALYKHCGC